MADAAADAPASRAEKIRRLHGKSHQRDRHFRADSRLPSWSAASSTPSCTRSPICSWTRTARSRPSFQWRPEPTAKKAQAARSGSLLRHRSAAGGEFRRRIRGALSADHHGSHGARSEGHRQRAEEHSADPQQSAAADEQSQLSIADVARRQGEAARRKRLPKCARYRRKRADPTSMTCCSPVSWCSNGGEQRARSHFGRRGVGAAGKE